MSEGEGSSSEECSLRIDTGRKPNITAAPTSENRPKGRGGRGKGKGRGKGSGQPVEPSAPPKIGDVVWAKVMGFNFWPAKIFDAANDDVVPVWLKQPPKPSYILVRFFGTYDMQWVSPNSIETYNKGLSKKFQAKSRSKVFQKAVKEVFAYMEDLVLPEGLTLRPPDPPFDDHPPPTTNKQNTRASTAATDSNSTATTSNGSSSAATTATTSTSTNRPRGSSRRKSSTPHRRFSSSSSDSMGIKRPRLNSEDGEGSLSNSPNVQAFTCAPLPLANPSEDTQDKQDHASADLQGAGSTNRQGFET